MHLAGRDRSHDRMPPVTATVEAYASIARDLTAADMGALNGCVALLHSRRIAARLAELMACRADVAIVAMSHAVAAAAGNGWRGHHGRRNTERRRTDRCRRVAGRLTARRVAGISAMNMDSEPLWTGAERRKRWPWPWIVAICAVAFVAGLFATHFAMRAWNTWNGAPAAAPASTSRPADEAAFSPRAPLDGSEARSDYETLSTRETALSAQVAQLEGRLTAIQGSAQNASADANRAEGLLVAFAARRAIDRGLGLGYLEGQLRARFGAGQPRAVATIVSAARQPVTLEDLREGIEAISPELQTGNTTDGWWSSFRREISDLVVIRRDAAPSPRPSDRLERAGRMLDGGQVEAALAEVARLPGAASGDRWIAAARRYIDARRALDAVETAAIIGEGRDPYAAAPAAPVPPQAAAGADPVTGAPLPE